MPAPNPSIYLAAQCYGGLAHADFMTAVLALRSACAQRSISLQVDLGGGEALIGRGRAAMMAKFLASQATHIVLTNADRGFEPAGLLNLLSSGHDLAGEDDSANLLLVTRGAARRMADAHPHLLARLGDLQGAGAVEAVMVFDPLIQPGTGKYLTDLEAFRQRWRDIPAEQA